MADRSRLAAERVTVSVVRAALTPNRIAFRALEGTMVVRIEADNEDDAHAICAEHGLEFVSLCED